MSYPKCNQDPTNPNCTCDSPGVPVKVPINAISEGDPSIPFWTCCGGNPRDDLGYCKYTNFKPTTQQEQNIHQEVLTLGDDVNKMFPQKCYSHHESSTGLSIIGCDNNEYPRRLTFDTGYKMLDDCYCSKNKNVWDEGTPSWATERDIVVSLPINCSNYDQSICQTVAKKKVITPPTTEETHPTTGTSISPFTIAFIIFLIIGVFVALYIYSTRNSHVTL